jgi:hypothetical protein
VFCFLTVSALASDSLATGRIPAPSAARLLTAFFTSGEHPVCFILSAKIVKNARTAGFFDFARRAVKDPLSRVTQIKTNQGGTSGLLRRYLEESAVKRYCEQAIGLRGHGEGAGISV